MKKYDKIRKDLLCGIISKKQFVEYFYIIMLGIDRKEINNNLEFLLLLKNANVLMDNSVSFDAFNLFNDLLDNAIISEVRSFVVDNNIDLNGVYSSLLELVRNNECLSYDEFIAFYKIYEIYSLGKIEDKSMMYFVKVLLDARVDCSNVFETISVSNFKNILSKYVLNNKLKNNLFFK